MSYKLNLHAHTRYSDGHPTVLELATAYKEHGFTCAVISDHYYGRSDLEHYSMTKPKFAEAVRDAEEAEQKLGYPVIVGMEYGFFQMEEVLCFGREFIKRLYGHVGSIEEFIELRKQYPSACVVAHPCIGGRTSGNNFITKGGHLAVDGFEHYNSGQNFFKPDYRDVPEEFKELTAFSNADAHQTSSLNRGYNMIESEINSETDLIDYIVNKRPVRMFTELKGEIK